MLFKNKYYFLSNMYPCEIKVQVDGHTYLFSSVESAYQSFKCPEKMMEFVLLNGYEAKKYARTLELRKDWEEVKLDIMTKLVKQKFSDPYLLSKLKLVEGEIVETNYWGDTYWGKSYGKGQNHLGIILMDIRDEDKK